MLPKSDWAHLIPHAGAMCLLDEVVEWDAQRLHARSATHQQPDNPLRADGRLHAVNLCEYAAQAMAVHGALREREAGAAARLFDVADAGHKIGELLGDPDRLARMAAHARRLGHPHAALDIATWCLGRIAEPA